MSILIAVCAVEHRYCPCCPKLYVYAAVSAVYPAAPTDERPPRQTFCAQAARMLNALRLIDQLLDELPFAQQAVPPSASQPADMHQLSSSPCKQAPSAQADPGQQGAVRDSEACHCPDGEASMDESHASDVSNAGKAAKHLPTPQAGDWPDVEKAALKVVISLEWAVKPFPQKVFSPADLHISTDQESLSMQASAEQLVHGLVALLQRLLSGYLLDPSINMSKVLKLGLPPVLDAHLRHLADCTPVLLPMLQQLAVDTRYIGHGPSSPELALKWQRVTGAKLFLLFGVS